MSVFLLPGEREQVVMNTCVNTLMNKRVLWDNQKTTQLFFTVQTYCVRLAFTLLLDEILAMTFTVTHR